MMGTREGIYVPGDYYLLCDICGFKKRRSECAKDWEGKLVCATTCLDQRNPQDYIQARGERQSVVDARNASALYVEAPGLYLAMQGSGYAWTPHASANAITGDIEFVFHVALADWTPSGNISLISKSDSITARAYGVQIAQSTGRLQLWFSTTGSDFLAVASTASPSVSDGGELWLKVNRASASGVGNFFTGSDGETWTRLGAADVAGTAGAIFGDTSPLRVGARFSGAGIEHVNGSIFYGEIRSAIDGSPVVVFDPDDALYPGAQEFASAETDELWTLNPTATIRATAGAGVQPGDL